MSTPQSVTAKLVLQDGSVFTGVAFGDLTPRTTDGEVCFNTSLSGYQEVLTDPSYAGQIETMTCPLIGNYGVNELDLESARVHVAGFVVRELAQLASNYRCTSSLEQWLAAQKVTGITGIDTRALTRKLRITGAMNGVLSTEPRSDEDLVAAARAAPGLVGRNLVAQVAPKTARTWDAGLGDWQPIHGSVAARTRRFRVAALDCGAKINILRNLVDSGCDVVVLPYDVSAEQILEHRPDGVFVSNGPGDPEAVSQTITALRRLLGKVPIFGICLGHQLLALACGAKTYKLKFGHRGANQPVMNHATQRVEITTQNHGFAVAGESLPAELEVTHVNLNDDTIEGLRHRSQPAFSVQYHPEASAGPHDSSYLFEQFRAMLPQG